MIFILETVRPNGAVNSNFLPLNYSCKCSDYHNIATIQRHSIQGKPSNPKLSAFNSRASEDAESGRNVQRCG
jgi:hypothetical protein